MKADTSAKKRKGEKVTLHTYRHQCATHCVHGLTQRHHGVVRNIFVYPLISKNYQHA